jgi:hypothetical protein
MSCVASCCEEPIDDGQCELLWVLSGVYKGFGELENVRAVFSDVFSGLRLRRQLLDLILNALEVRERVLLYDFNQSKPMNREQSVLLLVRCEVLERLQKLLVERVVKLLHVLRISSYVILIELLVLFFRELLGLRKTRKEGMVLEYVKLLHRAICRVREVRRYGGSSLEQVPVEVLGELEQVSIDGKLRFDSSGSALWIIVLGSKGALLFGALELALSIIKKAREVWLRYVAKHRYVRVGSDLHDLPHPWLRGHKRGLVRRGFGGSRHLEGSLFECRFDWDLRVRRCGFACLGLFTAAQCDDALVFFNRLI